MPDTLIEPGALKKRLLIEVDVGTSTDNAGQHIENWQPWTGVPEGKIWAGIRGVSGREYERASQMQVYATHTITLRWVPGLTAVKMRGKLGSRIFEFGWVNNVEEANVKAEILAIERIA